MNRSTQAIRYYFEEKYPSRNVLSNLAGFRKDDSERIDAIEAFFPKCNHESICDMGCGDGLTLARLLIDVDLPEHIHLVDISKRFICLAKNNLEKYKKLITTENSSIFESAHQEFDIVIAIGISDYHTNWHDFINLLMSRTRKTLVIDFPKNTSPRNILRKVWLFFYGVPLHTISYKRLRSLLNAYPVQYEITDTKYNHVVHICK